MAQSNGLQLFLDRLLTRSALTDVEQQAILSLPTRSVRLNARQDFVPINEEASHGSLISSGVVARFGQAHDGRRQTTAFHLPGDMADLNSTVHPISSGGLTALADTTILRVPHTALRAVAARFPAIAESFWRDCVLDAAILIQWVVNLGRHDAQARVAHIICEMAVRSGIHRAIMLDFDFAITQEQLGDAAGLTSVHVNRTLKALRDRRLVTVRRGSFQIHNWKGLAKLGDFDPTYLMADAVPEPQTRFLAVAA